MHQFVSVMMVLLLMVPLVRAEQKPAAPNLVVVTILETGEARVSWSVAHGQSATGFKVYGKRDGADHHLTTVDGEARHYLDDGGYDDYAVSAVVGVEESDRANSCVTARASEPYLIVRRECLPVSVL